MFVIFSMVCRCGRKILALLVAKRSPVCRATKCAKMCCWLSFYNDAQSSHAREFHPCVLTEPCVKVSLHTALHVNKSLEIKQFQGCTNNQWANRLGHSLYFVCKYFTAAYLYNPFSHFTHLSSRAFN